MSSLSEEWPSVQTRCHHYHQWARLLYLCTEISHKEDLFGGDLLKFGVNIEKARDIYGPMQR